MLADGAIWVCLWYVIYYYYYCFGYYYYHYTAMHETFFQVDETVAAKISSKFKFQFSSKTWNSDETQPAFQLLCHCCCFFVCFPHLLWFVCSIIIIFVSIHLFDAVCETPLGMQSGAVKDADISASSSNSSHGATNARPFNYVGWCAQVQILRSLISPYFLLQGQVSSCALTVGHVSSKKLEQHRELLRLRILSFNLFIELTLFLQPAYSTDLLVIYCPCNSMTKTSRSQK